MENIIHQIICDECLDILAELEDCFYDKKYLDNNNIITQNNRHFCSEACLHKFYNK